jgi:hypothetical protein
VTLCCIIEIRRVVIIARVVIIFKESFSFGGVDTVANDMNFSATQIHTNNK